MKKNIFLVVGVGLSGCIPGFAYAEVFSTGSENADTILQWLTTIISIASVVANVTPTPVDNGGVRLLSLLVNIAAANWKQIKDAWGSAKNLAIGAMVPMIVGLSIVASQNADAAVCAADPAIACPKYSLCGQWVLATTREDGSAYPVSEQKNIIFAVGDSEFTLPPTQARYDFLVPKGKSLPAGTVISVWSVDVSGTPSSKKSFCETASSISGEKFPPAAPSGLKVTAN
jgi:hypothetical protein